EQQPQSGVYGPGESARLDCGVGGLPPPSISWRINGLPVEGTGVTGTQVVHGGGSLLLPQLQPNHSLVAQCEAQNPHGRLLANAFVLVLELPVQILSPPQELLEVLENGTALLPCRAFGTPTPTIEWLTPRQEPALLDERSFVFTNGSLRLSAVGRGDAGSYTCRAGNRHSNDSALVVLHVRGAL
ncbi:NGCA protein, partial [Rhinopomastus cyanomelas]|nr:NGCA protein [Rhinopomastus cyanomelas]